MSNALLHEKHVIRPGQRVAVKDIAPDDTDPYQHKEEAGELLESDREQLVSLQELLYAEGKHALLVVLQGMDTSGKDGTIRHVLGGVNPQGCTVAPFKVPTSEELAHDYLWRVHKVVPPKRMIGIFNRSHYEEVLVVRVHREYLDRQKLPRKLVTGRIWKERFEDIAAFERYAGRNGIVIRKFFLNVSKREQKKRFLERLDHPEKYWKFSAADCHERQYWAQYMNAYEEMIRHTATSQAPWYVVPADHKWYLRLAVAAVVVETLRSLNLQFPQADAAKRRELAAARAALMRSK